MLSAQTAMNVDQPPSDPVDLMEVAEDNKNDSVVDSLLTESIDPPASINMILPLNI